VIPDRFICGRNVSLGSWDLEQSIRNAQANMIHGGPVEVQKSIAADRGLGLSLSN
jgi:alkylation response protein AidB-like acyl-CoA dehydrogenase